jgi:transcriptional regulator of acetoin/glycerol metabolism
VEHALIICREAVIQPDHLPDYVRQVQHAVASPKPWDKPTEPHSQERRRILTALEKTGGHRRKAAQALGMERTTLWRKMKKYGLLS